MEKCHQYKESEWDGICSTAVFGKYLLWGFEARGWAFIPWHWLVMACVTRLLYGLTLFSWGQFLEKDSAIFLVANIPQGWRSECFSPKGGIWLITSTAGTRNIQVSLWTYISIYFAYTSRRGISGRCVFNFMVVSNSFPQWLLYLKFSAICWSSSYFTSVTAFDIVCFVKLF